MPCVSPCSTIQMLLIIIFPTIPLYCTSSWNKNQLRVWSCSSFFYACKMLDGMQGTLALSATRFLSHTHMQAGGRACCSWYFVAECPNRGICRALVPAAWVYTYVGLVVQCRYFVSTMPKECTSPSNGNFNWHSILGSPKFGWQPVRQSVDWSLVRAVCRRRLVRSVWCKFKVCQQNASLTWNSWQAISYEQISFHQVS